MLLTRTVKIYFLIFLTLFVLFLHEPTTSVRISPSWYVYQKQGVFLALSSNTKGMLLKRKRSGNYDLTWRLNYDNYCTCALIYGEEIATSFFLQDFFPFFTRLFCLFFLWDNRRLSRLCLGFFSFCFSQEFYQISPLRDWINFKNGTRGNFDEFEMLVSTMKKMLMSMF